MLTSDQHRIDTCEDVAELDPETWAEILNEAELQLPTSAKNSLVCLLKSVGDVPSYEYSANLGR